MPDIQRQVTSGQSGSPWFGGRGEWFCGYSDFLLNGLGAAVDGLEPLRVLPPSYWYLQDSPPLSRGFTASDWFLVVGIVVFTAAAIPGLRRREIAA